METKVFTISLESVQEAFERMEREAKWDTSQKLYWGYYFLHVDLKELEAFGDLVKQHGFEVVEIRKVEEEDYYMLHIEEQVVHTPESLVEQCMRLAELAKVNKIAVFDGWDVERTPMNEGLVD